MKTKVVKNVPRKHLTHLTHLTHVIHMTHVTHLTHVNIQTFRHLNSWSPAFDFQQFFTYERTPQNRYCYSEGR